jgi:hypothetical protein
VVTTVAAPAAVSPGSSRRRTCILFAHRLITDEQRGVGHHYRILRGRLFGVPLRNANGGPMPSEEKIAANEAAYGKMARRLSEDQRIAVADVALDIMPVWLRREVVGLELRDEDLAERAALISGLDRLAAS